MKSTKGENIKAKGKTNIVKVRFLDEGSKLPTGKRYTYRCDIEGIKIGDYVAAPTYRGDVKACIVRTNVPENDVDYPLDGLKVITERMEGEEDV